MEEKLFHEGSFYECLWCRDKGPWDRNISTAYHRCPELWHYIYCFAQSGEAFPMKWNKHNINKHTHRYTHTHIFTHRHTHATHTYTLLFSSIFSFFTLFLFANEAKPLICVNCKDLARLLEKFYRGNLKLQWTGSTTTTWF